MTTKSINTIVKEILIEEGLTLHSYMKYLHHCLTEVQRLAKKHRFAAKQIELTKNSYNRAPFPSDMVMMLDLSIKEGERILPMTKDSSLNRLYRYDSSGNKIAYADAEVSSIFNQLNIIDRGEVIGFDLSTLHNGGYFGFSTDDDQSFSIDYINQEFIFSNDTRATTIVLTYAHDPVSTSTANVVRHEYIDHLKAYAKWKVKEQDKMATIYEKEEYKKNYLNSKRELKAFLYPIRYADLVSMTRNGIHQGIKN